MAADQKFLEISLKDDFKEVFKAGPDSTLHENIGVSLAMAAFIEKRVTLARAAELASKERLRASALSLMYYCK